jgi:putative ABC transport system substrate-binding protein
MSQPALDSLRIQMEAQLRAAGYTNFVERNADGQLSILPVVAREFNDRHPAVIVAITTPAAQAVAKVAQTSLVFAAVTDPVGARIVPSLEHPGANITGTSDAWPYGDQLRLIREILPKAVRIGVIFNPGESAGAYGIQQLRQLAPQQGFEIMEGPVSSTSDVYTAARQLASRCDALLLDSDNTAIAGEAAAVRVAQQRKVPLFAGDSGSVVKGALGAVSVGYEQLGVETGKLVIRMLHGERNLPVYVGRGDQIVLNTAAASTMGVSLSPALLQHATHVYTEIAP